MGSVNCQDELTHHQSPKIPIFYQRAEKGPVNVTRSRKTTKGFHLRVSWSSPLQITEEWCPVVKPRYNRGAALPKFP